MRRGTRFSSRALGVAAAALSACVAFLGATGGVAGAPPAGLRLVPPPGGGVYHAAYPEFRGSEDHVRASYVRRFERLARKDLAWAYFSNNWTKGIRFPASGVARIEAAGAVPFIRLMARSSFRESGPDKRFSLQRIIDGEFDGELAAWGRAAAAHPGPLLVEFGTEVNGFWFPWNGKWNGGGATAGYGDPALPDGPERFRDAYRHVHDVIAAQGAEDLTWFWHVNSGSFPANSWNTYSAYYPGDDYVDWIGVSDYGPLTPDERFGRSFASVMDRVYPKLAGLSPDRPIAVLEYGARQGRAKAHWVSRAIASVASGRWPRVRALSYWHERWRNADGTISNLHIDSDRRTLRAYRRGIARPVFTGEATFTP